MPLEIQDATPSSIRTIVPLNDDIQHQHALADLDDFIYPTDTKTVGALFEKVMTEDD